MKKAVWLMSLLFLISGCSATVEKSAVEEQKDGTFKIDCIKENEWSGALLSSELIREAEEFCLNKGKKFERVELKSENDGRFNYTNVHLIFRCN